MGKLGGEDGEVTTRSNEKLEPLSTHSTIGGKGKDGWVKLEDLPDVVVHKDLIKE